MWFILMLVIVFYFQGLSDDFNLCCYNEKTKTRPTREFEWTIILPFWRSGFWDKKIEEPKLTQEEELAIVNQRAEAWIYHYDFVIDHRARMNEVKLKRIKSNEKI